MRSYKKKPTFHLSRLCKKNYEIDGVHNITHTQKDDY